MIIAKPFLKWAGGKTKLIPVIEEQLLSFVNKNDKFTLIEPFVGSGAVFIWALQNFPNIERVIINDINSDLINAYNNIKSNHIELINALRNIENAYFSTEEKLEFYLDIRAKFNERTADPATQASYMIFLNKTCFNGLYRVNKKNLFNVPFGKQMKPTICNEENIIALNKLMQKVTILHGDFEQTLNYTHNKTVFYFDPPYRPLPNSASFTTYAKEDFNDEGQVRLRDFCHILDDENHSWILSNSDMKNVDKEDEFFDELFERFNINRVRAARFINSKGTGRGMINELLISNNI